MYQIGQFFEDAHANWSKRISHGNVVGWYVTMGIHFNSHYVKTEAEKVPTYIFYASILQTQLN